MHIRNQASAETTAFMAVGAQRAWIAVETTVDESEFGGYSKFGGYFPYLEQVMQFALLLDRLADHLTINGEIVDRRLFAHSIAEQVGCDIGYSMLNDAVVDLPRTARMSAEARLLSHKYRPDRVLAALTAVTNDSAYTKDVFSAPNSTDPVSASTANDMLSVTLLVPVKAPSGSPLDNIRSCFDKLIANGIAEAVANLEDKEIDHLDAEFACSLEIGEASIQTSA